jgi:biopolymer transport protein ExbD
MLLRRQVEEARDEHIDMTPMVDVVFQLMTFMLFASQMTGGEQVDVPAARHGVGVDENSATIVTLFKPLQPGGEPRLVLGNGKGDPVTYDQVRQAVTFGVEHGRRKVVVQADGAVTHGDVLKLIAEVSEVEGITVHVGVQEPQ